MLVEPKALVRRLTPTATRLLEAAVARASASQCHEIVVEHLLVQLLEDDKGDTAHLLETAKVSRPRLVAKVERVLSALRTGNAGRPVFSETLFQWMEDAWLLASVELGATSLRSGVLFAQFCQRMARYTAEHYTELDGEVREALRSKLAEVLDGLPEALEATPTGASNPAPQGGSAAGGPEALKRFATNFTQQARDGKIDPIFGRDREIRQVVDILSRRRKNNPIIVGEPGVGKTALVEGLALAIAHGDVPEALRNVELYGLDLGSLQAGAGVKGEFENRLKAVIQEVKASPKPVILFIDEAHTLIGAGGAAGGSDAANLLKPALARGELRTIAATTWSEYKKYFEKDAALERRFQPVKVEEPSEEDAVAMIRGLARTYEAAHNVVIRDEAVVAAVRLSHRFLTGRQLPDKAVDLLDTAAARVKLELAARPEQLVQVEAEVATLERARAANTRDLSAGHPVEPQIVPELEAKLAAAVDRRASILKRWEDEKQSVAVLQAAQKAFLEAKGEGAALLREELLRAQTALAALQGEEPLLHPEVTADVVARVIASWTGIPAGRMRADALTAALNLEATLRSRVRGQDAALRAVSEVVQMAHAGVRNPNTPVGVLLFVGPSGVGKTETATALADALYGGERFMTVINMSEFQEKHTVSRLVGSPPGYVGYGEGGVLTEAVRQRPYSVVLLDECEKADLDVMNLFYQVFDKGVLNDGEGRTINFRNTLVILTSNLATDRLMELYQENPRANAEDIARAIRPVLSSHFKPALLARMTIVPFAPIAQEVLKDITQLKLDGLAQRLLASHRLHTTFDPELVAELARRCTEAETGARNVDHILRSSLMPALAKELLQRLMAGPLPRRLAVSLLPNGEWNFHFTEG